MKVFLIYILILFSCTAMAKLKVLTTLPDLAEVISEIGGEHVEVQSLLNGTEDPHFVDASPSYILKVSNADIVCFVGLELEVGWLPKVLERSGNDKVQNGGAGYCDLGQGISVIDKPKGPVDRSMGDVHASGNPHFYLSPVHLVQMGKRVVSVLSVNEPAQTKAFEAGFAKFQKRMALLQQQVETLVSGIRGTARFMEFHKEFSYFFKVYGLQLVGSIEDKPGVPPSASRLARVARQAREGKVSLAVAGLYSSRRHMKKFAELSGLQIDFLPTNVVMSDSRFDSIEKVQLALAKRLVEAASAP